MHAERARHGSSSLTTRTPMQQQRCIAAPLSEIITDNYVIIFGLHRIIFGLHRISFGLPRIIFGLSGITFGLPRIIAVMRTGSGPGVVFVRD